MVHHIMQLYSMASLNKNAEMLEYLDKMEQAMINPREHVSSGDKDIDGILNFMLGKAVSILKKLMFRSKYRRICIPVHLSWRLFLEILLIMRLKQHGRRRNGCPCKLPRIKGYFLFVYPIHIVAALRPQTINF